METETPNIQAVRADKNRSLAVTWKNGTESIVDVAQYLAGYAIFAPLVTDDTLFRAVNVGEWGWSAHWSDDLEIPVDTLRRLALEQGG